MEDPPRRRYRHDQPQLVELLPKALFRTRGAVRHAGALVTRRTLALLIRTITTTGTRLEDLHRLLKYESSDKCRREQEKQEANSVLLPLPCKRKFSLRGGLEPPVAMIVPSS